MNDNLVTGGAGFIGSNFVLQWLKREKAALVNLDRLTYAGNLANVASVSDNPRYAFAHGDINDRELVGALLAKHQPAAIVHFAAESHVDRSILGPEEFIQTNVQTVHFRCWKKPERTGRSACRKMKSRAFGSFMCRPTRCTGHSGRA